MSFAEVPVKDVERLANELLALLDAGAPASDRLRSFTEIETTSHGLGRQIAALLTSQLLRNEADQHDEHEPCPKCGQACRVTRHRRVIHGIDGMIDYHEPAAHCVECRRDFFPSAVATGLE